jgi:hypothetical protein
VRDSAAQLIHHCGLSDLVFAIQGLCYGSDNAALYMRASRRPSFGSFDASPRYS